MIQIWIQATRPKTLVAAIVPVTVGTCLAFDAGELDAIPALLCLVFALLVQIGTNFANDYYDHRRGADTVQRLGPVRTVASGLILPSAMMRATAVVLGLAFLVGLGLLPYGGWKLLVVGIVSLICAIAYTGGPFPLAYLGLGDLFVVGFFGLVSVGFTYFVQTGEFTGDAWLAGLAVGLVVNNLLVVNNYRDVEEDRRSGKKTLAVRLGRSFSIWQYWLQTLGACACIAGLAVVDAWFWLLPMMVLGFMGRQVLGKLPNARTRADYDECLGATAPMIPVFGILLCVGILT